MIQIEREGWLYFQKKNPSFTAPFKHSHFYILMNDDISSENESDGRNNCLSNDSIIDFKS